METALWKVTFKDGRIYKIFCANKRQNANFVMNYKNTKISHLIESVDILEKGIHTAKQWTDILNNHS